MQDEDLTAKYTIIKVVFMPTNSYTTSVLDLDLGVIKNLKVYCHNILLQHIIAEMERCSTTHEVVKSVDVLIAVKWVGQAWESVSSVTICFRKAGHACRKDFGVVLRDVLKDYIYSLAELEVDHGTDELQEMLTQVGIVGGSTCSGEDFTTADDQLSVCQDFINDTWNTDFQAEIGPRN